MKKLTAYTLLTLLIIVLIIEYTYSVVHALVEAVGLKINEASDALEIQYQKAKN
jgi:hypothetical protein